MSDNYWFDQAWKNLALARRWRDRLQPGISSRKALHIMQQVVGYTLEARRANRRGLSLKGDIRRHRKQERDG